MAASGHDRDCLVDQPFAPCRKLARHLRFPLRMTGTSAKQDEEAADAGVRGPGADIGEGILEYLRSHPQASDTSTGICTWWLPAQGIYRTEAQVKAVLEQLAEEGAIERIALGDAPIYRRRAGGGDRG